MTSLMPPHIAFKLKVAAATTPTSRGGEKIIKPEFEDALLQLGTLSEADRALVKTELEGKPLSQSVRRAYVKLTKGVDTAPALSAATKQRILDRFESLRSTNALGESFASLPLGAKMTTFTLEDSTCKPHMVCIWAGELYTAHVPQGAVHAGGDPNQAEVFFVGRSSPGQAAKYYGPFDIPEAQLTRHTPKVEGARFDGGNGVQIMPGMPSPSRPPAIVLKASFYPIDVEPSFQLEVKGKIVTITCDSTRPEGTPIPRGLMQPKDFRVPFQPPEPGATYTLRVVDREGAPLIPDSSFTAAMPV